MLMSESCKNMLNLHFVFVCFLISSSNASAVKRYVAFRDLFNDTIIEASPSLPLEQFGEKYYYFGAIYQGNYFQAIQFCNHHDMTLLSIETKEENDFLYRNLKNFLGYGEYFFWTSGTKIADPHWVWLSTGKPIIYANWFPHQPDDAGNNEKCLEVRYSPKNEALMWNDHVCNERKYVICEISLPKRVSKLLSSLSNCNLTLINVPAV